MTESSTLRRAGDATGDAAEVLRVRDLHVTFGRRHRVHAVNGVDFDLAPAETLALVGESGSGKSTTARAALRLIDIDSGQIELLGRDLTTMNRRELRRSRRHAQMVFQDPYSSLDPSMTVRRIVEEPLLVHTRFDSDQRRARVVEVLEMCGVGVAHLDRYPAEFSGGQRQRIAIARAIVTNPEVVIADEAVSALDVSIRNQVLNLFRNLQEELGLAYLFITHDLGVVEQIAHRVAIMYLGQIVETGPTEAVFTRPRHPYTRALLDARPDLRRDRREAWRPLPGDPPDPVNLPVGCAFAERCPIATNRCRKVAPAPHHHGDGHWTSCHHDGRVMTS